MKVNIVAEGEDDPKATGRTSIKVNGIERSPMMRGHNIVVLDSDRNFIMAANFDTADSTKGEGVKMATFLQQLPQERIVLIGTQGTTGGFYWFRHREPTQATCVALFFLGTLCLLQRNCLRLAKYVLIANRPKTPCGLAFTVVVVVVNNLSCEQALPRKRGKSARGFSHDSRVCSQAINKCIQVCSALCR